MPERLSTLAECRPASGLSHCSCALLLQYHAWPDHYERMAAMLAARCGIEGGPRPGRAASGVDGSLLRIHPQRLWLMSDRADSNGYPPLGPETGATLDLSHARSIIHVAQELAVPLLSRFIAIDLRPHRFAVDDVATTPLHRVSVVLWRRADGTDILAPRSFARSIWQLLAETAERLG
jgi:methylglutamate dehydrogenase subunit D